VLAAHRDEAARPLERVTKERLRLDRLCPGVERRHLRVFEGVAPPARDQAATHRDELASALFRRHDIDRICRADVVAWPQIVRRRVHRQPLESHEFSPGRLHRETVAH
jgi:hypothetical protein